MGILAAFIMPHPPLIIPEVGKGEEKKIQKTIDAYEEAARRIAELRPETIVVVSPHSVAYADYLHISPGSSAHGDFGAFGAPQSSMRVRYDSEFVRTLTACAGRAGIPAGTYGEQNPELDHGTMVPLSFVNRFYSDYRLVRCSISGLNPGVHYAFGKCIAQAVNQLHRRVVLIASGDLSHKLKPEGPYGYAQEGPEFDRMIVGLMKTGNFLQFLNFDGEFCEAAGECGLRSFQIMAGAMDGQAVKSELLSYEGPFGVGYAVCAVYPQGPDSSRCFGEQYEAQRREKLARLREGEDEYVRLARLSLETYVKEGRPLHRPAGLSDELTARKAGVFVSLKKDGKLRGCIGTIEATQDCIADEIIHNAVSAGVRDPRFEPVTKDELEDLVYSVDVLGEAEPVASAKELDAKRYGVIMTSGARCGLLLPNLSGVDTPEQQIEIARQKAGIPKGESYSLQRFEVVRHK